MHTKAFPSFLQWGWRLCLAGLLIFVLTATQQRVPVQAGPRAAAAAACACPVGPYADPLPGSYPAVKTSAYPNIGYSPNGIYKLTVSGTSPVNLTVTRVVGGANLLNLTLSNGFWGFSPDDDRFTYHSMVSGVEYVYLYNLAGATPSVAVWNGGSTPSSSRLVFSPNGHYFMYESVSGVNNTSITIVDATTGSLKYNTSFSFQTPPGSTEDVYGVTGWGFSPELADHGFVFAYVSGQSSVELRLVNLGLAAATRLVYSETITAASAFWQFSPCGEVLGLVTQTTATQQNIRLFKVVDGTKAADIATGLAYTVLSSKLAATDLVNHVATVAGVDYNLATLATPGACMPGTAAVSNLKLSPASVQGGSPSTGTVTLNQAAPTGGTPVTLSSSNPNAATTPPNVTVAGGATSATFTVTTTTVSVNTDLTISASAGGATRSAILTIQAPLRVLDSITVNPTSVLGGNPSTASVRLTQPAPAGGAVVNLSSDSTAAPVPASVNVPMGATTQTFTIATNPVATATSVTISATFGSVTKTAVITLNPPTLATLTVPATSTGGVPASGTVTLNGRAPTGGSVIGLKSSDPSVAAVPTSVLVPGNATSADFAITSVIVSTPTSVTLTATFGGSSLTGNLTVKPTQLKSLTFDHFRVQGGMDATGHVNLAGPAPSGGIVVTLSTSNSTLTTPPASVTVPAGSSATTITVHTKGVTTPIEVTISATSGSVNVGSNLRLVAPPIYTVTNLGTLPGDNASKVAAINAAGQMVGGSWVTGGVVHAFLYSGGTMTMIPPLPGFDSAEATGINASGRVVGRSWTGASCCAPSHAFLYDANTQTVRDLGTLGGATSRANGINDAGQIVGAADTAAGNSHAFLYDQTTQRMQDLGTLGGSNSEAFAINAKGQVVGNADDTINDCCGSAHAFLYDQTKQSMQDLGTLGGGVSWAQAINSEGQVVGYGRNANDSNYGFLYDSGGMHDTGCLATCFPTGINDAGKIVEGLFGMLYQCGTWSDLKDLVPADSVSWLGAGYALTINNAGQIVGAGSQGQTTDPRAMLLTPISTPDAPLTATGGNAVSAVEGKSLPVRVAGFTDADPKGIAGCFQATTIDWGDGTSTTGVIAANPSGGFIVTGYPAYREIGTYTYTVTIRDVDGATASVTGTATVVDAPLDPAGTSITAVPGTASTGVVGGFADESQFGVPGDFTATINWGDGSATSSGTVTANGKGGFDVTGTHTFTNSKGLYPISIAVTDVDGSTVTIESTANAGVDQVAAFPVMSNKAYGGYLTAAYVQNLGTAPAAVLIRYYDQSGQPVGGGDLRLNLPVNGNWTVRQDTGKGLPPAGAGSAIVFSTQPLAAFVNEFPPTKGSDGSSYTAIPMPGGGGTTLYAPAIFNKAYGGYFTGIGLVNLGSAPSDVTITYRNADGTVAKTQTLSGVPARAYRAVYQGDPGVGLPVGFAGTATIISSGQPLAAIVNEVGNNGFSSYAALAAGSSELQAPVALDNAFGGYFTSMAIQNTSSSAGTVTVTYYDSAGVPTIKTSPIGANGSIGIYQGDATLGPAPGSYTARLSSTVPIAAIVNEVFQPTPSLFTTYNAFAGGLSSAHLALVQNAGSDGLTTALGIMNLSSAAADVTISYYNADTGVLITSKTFTVAAGAFLPRYTPDDLPTKGTRATAVVSSAAQLAVICNEVADGTLMSYAGQ